jgi:hypothetical protein
VILWIGATADFAIDFTCCYQQAAARALDDPSSLYDWSATYTFRYPPIGALAFVPLVPLPADVAAVAWLGVKLVALGVAATWFSAPWSGARRWLVAGLVVTFPPVVHDLMIGNVSTFSLLALIAVARWPDARGGIVLGALAILAPKPHLLPVLAWMAIRRPRQFAGAAAAIAAGTILGLAAFGLEPWLEFASTLREPMERTFTANVGFSALAGPTGVVVGLVAAGAVWAFAVRRADGIGLGLSIVSGVLLGPYTFIHYLAGTLVAAEPILRSHPRRLAPFPWLLIVFPLIPFWLLALAGLLHRVGRRPSPRVGAAVRQATARG